MAPRAFKFKVLSRVVPGRGAQHLVPPEPPFLLCARAGRVFESAAPRRSTRWRSLIRLLKFKVRYGRPHVLVRWTVRDSLPSESRRRGYHHDTIC
jgi:hypothetical protein